MHLSPPTLRRLLFAALVCAPVAPALPAAGQTDTFKLAATIRDFKSGANAGGHPDFDTSNEQGRSDLTYGMVAPMLGADGLPVYNPTRPTNPEGNDPLTTEANFNQWYRDTPGVNQTVPIEIAFGPKTDDPGVMTTEGYNAALFTGNRFLPIPGLGWGNETLHDGGSNNWNFTTVFKTEFSYRPTTAFKFIGDDDVWVYVNDHLSIDLGGTHQAKVARFLMLDGKIFLGSEAFPPGGEVQAIDSAYLSTLETFWTRLGMTESLPLTGSNTFIDLDLPIGPDVRGVFNVDSVQVFTAGPPPASVRLDLIDDTTEEFTAGVNGGRFVSSAGKQIRGIWVQAEDGTEQYVTPGGMQAGVCELDFFHAERHYSSSTFQIETTLLGDEQGNGADFTGYD